VTPTQTVLLVVGIVAAVGAIQAAIWIPLLARLRRIPGELSAELQAAGEPPVHGPRRANFEGSTASIGGLAGGSGALALTRKRFVFRRVFGAPVEVPLDQVSGIHADKVRRVRGYRRSAGWRYLTLDIQSGGQVAFSVPAGDESAWIAAFQSLPANQ
jgi:hypothetical protein